MYHDIAQYTNVNISYTFYLEKSQKIRIGLNVKQ